MMLSKVIEHFVQGHSLFRGSKNWPNSDCLILDKKQKLWLVSHLSMSSSLGKRILKGTVKGERLVPGDIVPGDHRSENWT